MKKIIFCLFLFICFDGAFAQQNNICMNAVPLCSNPSFTFNANSGPGSIIDFSVSSSISNPTNNPFPPNSGCLKAGELNPQWLLLTIGNAGSLEFVFGAGNSANPQSGFYDWAMWPYSPTACSGIFNNTLPPVRCNWNGSPSGGTGIASSGNIASVNGSAVNFGSPLQVNACEQFVICISNYSGVNTLVSFQSLGTASLSCSPNCSPNYSICYGSSVAIVPVNYAALANPVFSMQPGGISNTTGSFVVSPSVTSTYTIFITGTNVSNAVQTTTSVSTVSVNAQPLVAPTFTQSSCASSSNGVNMNLTFNPSNPSPNYTITWSPIPNGVLSPSQTAFTGGISPGLYNATVTTANGCSLTTNFSINPIPAPAVIIVNPLGTSHTITCFSAVTLTAMNASYNYTWSSIVGNFTGPVAAFTSTMVGTWVLTAQNPSSNCTATQTFFIAQNTVAPIASITPTLQNITCSLSSITTVTATASPSVNVTHQILSPQGGTFSAQSYTTIYTPGGVGTYTHCVVNNANGCSFCETFTVASNQGFPTYSVVSAQNFTLGCNTKSLVTINIINANTNPTGGPVSYTLLAPGASSSTPGGSLSAVSNYTVTTPGTWTVITKDNTSFCETRTPISILSNTFSPDISAIVPTQVLDCNVPRITLTGQSLSNNVSYLWAFPGTPGTLQGDTITVNSVSTSPNSSVVASYTLIITDNSSTCNSFSVIPINQNLYPPNAVISNGGTFSLSCLTSTIQLTNQSSTGIPAATHYPNSLPAIGYIWEGPTPQEPGQVESTYLAATVGVYTLTVKDLNNGCISQTTTVIGDNRIYPVLNKPQAPPPFVLDCGSTSRTITPNISGPTTGFTYSWVAVLGATISGETTATLTTNKIGNYRILITNTVNGCASLSEVNVVNGSLNGDFEVLPAQGYAPLEVIFYNNSVSTLGAANITSYWSFGNGTSSITTGANLSPTTMYTSPGTFTVTMFANKGTCLDTVVKYIQVEIPSVMEVPNVFTPNGDNVNDLFFLKATNLEEISILIYDRWGHKVYDLVSDKGNVAWDGKNQSGKDAAEGTYFYIIKATGKDGQSYDKKGTVSLYR
jgi:gliding motility-associated-like protein